MCKCANVKMPARLTPFGRVPAGISCWPLAGFDRPKVLTFAFYLLQGLLPLTFLLIPNNVTFEKVFVWIPKYQILCTCDSS